MALFFCGVVLAHYNSYNLSPTTRVTVHSVFASLASMAEVRRRRHRRRWRLAVVVAVDAIFGRHDALRRTRRSFARAPLSLSLSVRSLRSVRSRPARRPAAR
jgi:hypothetical protein